MRIDVVPVRPTDPGVVVLLDRLTTELAGGGYSADETFGYTHEQLAAGGVHLVGAYVGERGNGGTLAGVGGVELQQDDAAELKRCYVEPSYRGTGVADALLAALTSHAAAHGARLLRLETGVHQHAAIGFYRRAGFRPIERFGPYVASATSVCMERALPPAPDSVYLDA